MTSYQNTSEYYCGMTMNTYSEHCTDPNVYFNQSPTNYQMHEVLYLPENYEKQEAYPILSPESYLPESGTYDPTQRQIIHASGHFYENAPVSQYNLIQYTPLTPEPVSYPVFHLEPRPYQNHQYMAKRHRAQITILPSSKGNFKAVVKRKRKRTVFTTEQVEALENIFKTKQYVSREDRQEIVNKLQLNDKAVKIWFQNRRLKIKRMQDQDLEEQEDRSSVEHLKEERNSPDIARLDSVETEISKKTDEFGFVTLDDGVMGDLVNVIDDFLTKSSVDVPSEEVAGNNSSPIYEPISPASVSDSNEEDGSECWKPTEPNESLQRLFDLQTLLSL